MTAYAAFHGTGKLVIMRW